MQSRIVLVSDDSDFFEYIIPKLMIRKNDELFRYGFETFSAKIQLIKNAVFIINSENNEKKSLELLKLLKSFPVIVFAYNENPDFQTAAYNLGVLNFITPFSDDAELQAGIINALNIAALYEKNRQYREILVRNNIIKNEQEVFLDYENILDKELARIRTEASSAVLAAISPDDKSKFLIQPAQIETGILNNIRKNDILLNFAPSKYFLLLQDTNIENAEKIWEKIRLAVPEKIYAGFANIASKNRQQIVNEVLNKLHEAINCNMDYIKRNSNNVPAENFKIFRQEFQKKIEKTVVPVFYHIQQKYNGRLFNAVINLSSGDGTNTLNIIGRHTAASFTITSPGFTKINIDISYQTQNKLPQKRFSLEPNEFEAGFLEDLLEQFIMEFRKEINDDNT